ncbi:MAG: AMP-binding protein, partial [Gemmataceae bacterium]|nr:AMP-binding protein [Gemmataceae bacterium]
YVVPVGAPPPPPPPPPRGPPPPTLTTLRRVISAGAPARAADLARFVRLLPDGVEVFTPYGATEALPVANIGSREILAETRHLTDQGRGVCVGRPVAGVDVFVMPITDAAVHDWDPADSLPAGEVGEFVARGPVVTKKYFNRPEATKLAKLRDPSGAVMHRMGDVGYRDEAGRLWFCGRKSQRVVTPWGALFTDMAEPVFNTVKGVTRTALVGVTRDGVTVPVLCVETGTDRVGPSDPGVRADLESRLRAAGGTAGHTRRVETFLFYPWAVGFPVDVRHNAKINREKLARWADRKLGARWRPGDNTHMADSAAGAGSLP